MEASKHSRKNLKPKRFLAFLGLAILFWILTKFSKEYTATVDAQFAYENVPEEAVLAAQNEENVSFDMMGNGFEFLLYKLKTPTVTIDVAEYYDTNGKSATVPNAELSRIITTQLKRKLAVQNISLNMLVIPLTQVVSKKVAIRAVTELGYKQGYKLVDKIIIQPDSVVISAPEELLKDISEVNTVLYTASEVDSKIEGEVALDFTAENNQSISVKKVRIIANVEEFTQKQLTIPVGIENLPVGTTLKLLPDNITISFDVSIKRFNSITEEDFRVYCDYASRNVAENFMLPILASKPEGLLNIEMSERKIDYLVFK